MLRIKTTQKVVSHKTSDKLLDQSSYVLQLHKIKTSELQKLTNENNE